MKQELISIILPVYNVSKYLEECMKSIINQTYKNIEIIVVNDGSTDESDYICEKYKKLDNRIKVIHQKNQGLSAARNTGLNYCKGEYISFIDSDDYVKPDFIEKLYRAIKEKNTSVAICNYVSLYQNKDLRCEENLNYNNVCSGKNFINSCVTNTVVWNKLYSRNIWNNLRFDVGKLHEDLFIMHKIMYSCDLVSVVNEDLYVYRIRSDSITGRTFNIKRNLDNIEASENRLSFFDDKEKSFYNMCLVELIEKLRGSYVSTYVYGDKKIYIKELGDMIRRARECYKEYIFHNEGTYKCNVKSGIFICFPRTYCSLKILKNKFVR